MGFGIYPQKNDYSEGFGTNQSLNRVKLGHLPCAFESFAVSAPLSFIFRMAQVLTPILELWQGEGKTDGRNPQRQDDTRANQPSHGKFYSMEQEECAAADDGGRGVEPSFPTKYERNLIEEHIPQHPASHASHRSQSHGCQRSGAKLQGFLRTEHSVNS
jgi:hypothetical protein